MTNDSSKTGNDQPQPGELIPLRKAAEIGGLTQEHIAYLIRTGKLWGDKMGSPVWFTTEQAVREYLARDRKPGPKPLKGS
ncbi:hypothetical protein ACFLZW_03335 [Chloroflexota bacterium]